ncbi:MAG TPA: MlaD family protein [Ignavibacteriaceae bacterium]|jgi:phospholipid/cholesterol/gamma-HCH transport system substrate-binding protein|nr:MlaD family protein [Ignavibacteriaceae bacterium]
MRNERKTEIRVGITVIVAILLLIWVIGWAKNMSLNSSRLFIDVKFDNVAGLELGDNVTVSGVRKGFVESISVKEHYVMVKLSLESDVKLKQDALFSVMMLDLMGGKKVEINPGTSNISMNYSELQHGSYQADIPAVIALVGSLSSEIPVMVEQVNLTLTSINRFLQDKEFESNLTTTLENLTVMTRKLNGMIDENRDNLKSISSNTAAVTNDVKEFLSGNKEQINQTFDNLSELITTTDKLVNELTTIIEDTKTGKNNAGKLLNDENLIKDLNETLQSVKELTKLLNDQLKGKGINVDANIRLF